MDRGLGEAAAAERLRENGPNRVAAERVRPPWKHFLRELREPLILLLLATGALMAAWGELRDAAVILGVILALNTIEVANERRAAKAIRSLRRLAEPTARVLRDGTWKEVPAEILVIGDVVRLEPGRRVPADLRLVRAFGLAADESVLTGESLPVPKDAEAVLPAETPVAERRNLLFCGTLVTRGSGTGLVVQAGSSTELGRVAELTRQVRVPRTPLQKAMAELARWMAWLALGLSLLVPAAGVLAAGLPLRDMIFTGLALAFATVPEELPILVTLVLGLGAWRLSRQRVIVRRLEAVEALGAVTVIATDKTGTLTENRMEVRRFFPPGAEARIREAALLCAVDDGAGADPMDAAVYQEASSSGVDAAALRAARPVLFENSFDSGRACMSVLRQEGAGLRITVKGSTESILARCEIPAPQAASITEEAARMGAAGLRVIACAQRRASPAEAAAPRALPRDQAESHLELTGLVGFEDPARPGARAAIQDCRAAGIRTVMITGDHGSTAQAVAQRVGLDRGPRLLRGADLDRTSDRELARLARTVSIYARASPEHKLRIVRALQEGGERVALTGDGVNDAPALAAAEVGVAMGETGSDVAREAAGIVLADDDFSTIAGAVREGRHLFENLSKAVRYYLACKLALVLATLVPVLLQLPVPFAPIQIILMELFMDLAASAAFAAEPAEGDLMRRAPRDPALPFMDRGMTGSILAGAIGLAAAVTAVYLASWYGGAGPDTSRTAAFACWILGHALLALNLRSHRQPLARIGILSNRFMAAWAAAAAGFAVVVVTVPALNPLVSTVPLGWRHWLLAAGCSVIGSFWLEIRKLASSRVK